MVERRPEAPARRLRSPELQRPKEAGSRCHLHLGFEKGFGRRSSGHKIKCHGHKDGKFIPATTSTSATTRSTTAALKKAAETAAPSTKARADAASVPTATTASAAATSTSKSATTFEVLRYGHHGLSSQRTEEMRFL